MSIQRIHSSEVQVFAGSSRIPAVQSLNVSTQKPVNDVRRLGALNVTERVLGANPISTLDIGILLTTGATGIDPFYTHQAFHAGFLNTGKQDFTIKDFAGATTVSGASLTSYSLNASVGELVNGTTSYEGSPASFNSEGAISFDDQSNDNFKGFFRPSHVQVTTTTDGDEGIDSTTLNIQNLSLSVDLPRQTKIRLGSRTPLFRYPELPAAGSLSFSVLKTKVTGVNVTSMVCESGVIKIDLKDDDDNSVIDFLVSGCCLESIEESTALDDNTTVGFNYYFPIIQ
tara:strand:+ start:11295 stop:12149 length:855 start_codon:yes stop_codon:yes gene_type:complete